MKEVVFNGPLGSPDQTVVAGTLPGPPLSQLILRWRSLLNINQNITVSDQYRTLGFTDRTYSLSSIESLLRCVEDLVQIQRTAFFIDDIEQSLIQGSNGLPPEGVLNTTPEGQAVNLRLREFQEAYSNYSLYGTAITARSTGNITNSRVNIDCARLPFLGSLYQNSLISYLTNTAVPTDYDDYQDPKYMSLLHYLCLGTRSYPNLIGFGKLFQMLLVLRSGWTKFH